VRLHLKQAIAATTIAQPASAPTIPGRHERFAMLGQGSERPHGLALAEELAGRPRARASVGGARNRNCGPGLPLLELLDHGRVRFHCLEPWGAGHAGQPAAEGKRLAWP
jgi:hypothetical protein